MVGTSSDLTGREAELFRGQARRKRVRSNMRRDVYVFEASRLLPLLGTGLPFNATSFAVGIFGSCWRMVRKLTYRSCNYWTEILRQKVQPDVWHSYPGLSCVGTLIHYTTCITLKSTSGLDQRESSQSRYDEMKRWTGRDGSSRECSFGRQTNQIPSSRYLRVFMFFSFFYDFSSPPSQPSLPPSTTTCKPAVSHHTLRLGTTQSLSPKNEHQTYPQFSSFSVLGCRFSAIDSR